MKLNTQSPSMDCFREKCRENNLKMTPQRIVIYKELLKSKDHPNAEALFKRIKKIIPDISLDTVNRTLITFSKIRIIDVVEGYGDPRRYDPDIDSHHHFRCFNCNTIIDFNCIPFNGIKVPDDIENNYTVLNKKILLEGYCYSCRQKKIIT